MFSLSCFAISRPSRWFSAWRLPRPYMDVVEIGLCDIGMIWKCAWNTVWYAEAPLFWTMFQSLRPETRRTAAERIRSQRPSSADSRAVTCVSCGLCERGKMSRCPFSRWLISKNASTTGVDSTTNELGKTFVGRSTSAPAGGGKSGDQGG